MSHTNGTSRLPEGAVIATLDMLRTANSAIVQCPRLSEQAGAPVYVRVRAIRRSDYLQMLPPAPPGSEDWPAEPAERAAKMVAWLETLPEVERALRQVAIGEVTYKVLAAGLREPTVDLDGAREFTEDADLIAVEILRLSGILPKAEAPKAEEKVEVPAEAPPA